MGLTPPRIEIREEAGDWSAVHDFAALARRAAQALADEIGWDGDGFEVGLLLTDDAGAARLNGAFRGAEKPTNVLSWPAFPLSPGSDAKPPPAPAAPEADALVPLGDVALAAETIGAEAAAAGLAFDDHATHLIVHALLHLLGYDHRTDAEAAVMEGIERRALARIGVADPYG